MDIGGRRDVICIETGEGFMKKIICAAMLSASLAGCAGGGGSEWVYSNDPQYANWHDLQSFCRSHPGMIVAEPEISQPLERYDTSMLAGLAVAPPRTVVCFDPANPSKT